MPAPCPDDTRRARIARAVLESLPRLRSQRQKAWAERTVALLMLVDPCGPGTPPARYRKVGRDATRAELKQIIVLTDQTMAASDNAERARLGMELDSHIGGLHQTTIVALANAGNLVLAKTLSNPDRLAAAAGRALGNLRRVKLRSGGGRPMDVRARAVVAILTALWRYRTGRRPRYSTNGATDERTGPFYSLVKGVFAALGLKTDPGHFTVVAVRRVSKRKRARHRPDFTA